MNLEWENNYSKNLITWEEATEYAFSLMFDWRLPTREELIFAYRNGVKGFEMGYYWTSSSIPEKYKYRFPKTYCIIHLRNGFVNYKKNYDLNYVRCVRDVIQKN